MQPTSYERVGAPCPDSPSVQVLIALGANLPFGAQTPVQTLRAAMRALEQAGFADLSVSRLYETPCFPPKAGPDYVNAAAAALWSGDADSALAALHTIEAAQGRARDTRWGMRTLDLDLLAFGQQVVPDLATYHHWHSLPPDDQARRAPDRLILPHPRLAERGFVLVPLAEVAPNWVHPVTNKTVAQMLAALDAETLREIRPFPEESGF